MTRLHQRSSQLGILPTDDSTTFGDGDLLIDDDRCKSQRMHVLQFLRAEVIGIPLPLDNLVRDFELFLPAWVQSEIYAASIKVAEDQRTSSHRIL